MIVGKAKRLVFLFAVALVMPTASFAESKGKIRVGRFR